MGGWFRNAPAVEHEAPGPRPQPFPAPAAARPAEPEVAEATPEEPKKKRGFWSRLFGRGDRNEDRDKTEDVKKDDAKKPRPQP
jgi:hypothetical protein